MRQTQTKQRVLVFNFSGLPENKIYETIMDGLWGLSKVAGVRRVHLDRWGNRLRVFLEPDADADMVAQLVERRLEALRVYHEHQGLFEQVDKSVTYHDWFVSVDLNAKLRYVLGVDGLNELINRVKALDIDGRTLLVRSGGFVVKPNKKRVVFFHRLHGDILFYLNLIIASKLMDPDARRQVQED